MSRAIDWLHAVYQDSGEKDLEVGGMYLWQYLKSGQGLPDPEKFVDRGKVYISTSGELLSKDLIRW